MLITTFQSKKTTHKIPVSPSGDNQFIFETKKIDNILDVYNHLTSHFILNIPLTRNVKTRRRKKDLKDYFVQKLEYIIIDIDHIKSISDRELCVKFFRDNNYNCILGESRNELNLKGVLEVDCNIKEAKAIVKEINEKINGYGDFDYAVIGQGTYQAPTLKHNIFYKNLEGKKYPTPQIKNITQEHQEINIPQNIQELCTNKFKEQGFVFHEVVENFFIVSHYSEKNSPRGFRWYPDNPFMIHHWNTQRNVNIWEDIIKTKEYKDFKRKEGIQQIKGILKKVPANEYTRYLNPNKNIVQHFLDEKQLLKVQSPMGTGKSAIIEEVLRQCNKKGIRVLFITNRISLADDISKKYPGIKHYLGTELEENEYGEGDSLVVQLDSLHKFSTKYFDLVILDEFSTTMQKMLDLSKHAKKITTQIFSLKKKKIVALDAILFDEHLELFHSKEKWSEIINGYRDNVELHFYKQKDNFISKLLKTAREKPITFSSGSTRILTVTRMMLEENGISCISITSETPQEQKKLIYESFKNKKPRWQVVMYSPTLTVGISNENNITEHFHYDTGGSMDVLSSLQMTKRTRQAEKIHFFLQERTQYRPTDLLKIQSELTDYMKQDEDGDTLGISEVGIKLSKVQKTFNILENYHKESFKLLLRFQFNINNKIIKHEEKITPFLNTMIKDSKKVEIDENLSLFNEYLKMHPEQVQEIISKLYSNKNDEQIKMFEYWKEDEELKKLSENNLKKLIQEEIKNPGIIESYKKIKQDNFLYKKVFSKKEAKDNLKEYGYKKQRNRWYINTTLLEVLNEEN